MSNSISSASSHQTTPDSWESRIQSASTFMGIPIKVVEEKLKILGVEKEPAGLEMLSDESVTPFGDIRAIFCENETVDNSGLSYKIPLAKVRMAMKYLRGPKNSQKTDSIDPELMALKTKYGIRMKMEDVDPSELLEYYHPELPNHYVTNVLRKKYGDQKIIVFKPDSKIVDIEATSNYIADLEQGFPEQDTVESDGVLVRIYEIGKIPNQIVEEDPLFEGKPLKRGRSIVNRINWSGIPLNIRQFCRIIADRCDCNIEDRFHVQILMTAAKEGIGELRSLYPEADLEYREKLQNDELPKLTLTMDSVGERKQDPFNVNRKH